jgi:hypothetical protein
MPTDDRFGFHDNKHVLPASPTVPKCGPEVLPAELQTVRPKRLRFLIFQQPRKTDLSCPEDDFASGPNMEPVLELEARDEGVGFACTGVAEGHRNRLTDGL